MELCTPSHTQMESKKKLGELITGALLLQLPRIVRKLSESMNGDGYGHLGTSSRHPRSIYSGDSVSAEVLQGLSSGGTLGHTNGGAFTPPNDDIVNCSKRVNDLGLSYCAEYRQVYVTRWIAWLFGPICSHPQCKNWVKFVGLCTSCR